MFVLSWNVHAIRGIGPRRLRRVMDAIASLEPDVVMLQEVGHKPELVTRFRDGLVGIGLAGFFYSGDPKHESKRYGNVIASRWRLEPHKVGWAPGSPWHQLLARATVTVDGTEVDVLSSHIPNGSGNGWRKIDTFEALASALNSAPDMPRILGGDFNEPRHVNADGSVITFGSEQIDDGSYAMIGDWTLFGETHPRSRWDLAVKSVLDGAATHGLRHAFVDRHHPENEVTHVTAANRRFFDHILVSSHFEVEDAGYRHDWRAPKDGTKALSDHWRRGYACAWTTGS